MRSLAGQLVGGRKKGMVKTAGVGRPRRITPGTPSPKRSMPPKPITSATSPEAARRRLTSKKGVGQTAGQKRAIYKGVMEDDPFGG